MIVTLNGQETVDVRGSRLASGPISSAWVIHHGIVNGHEARIAG